MVAQPIDRGLPADRHADELERLLSLASTFQALQRLKPVRWTTEPRSELGFPSKPKLPKA
jgi:hypothetical protein